MCVKYVRHFSKIYTHTYTQNTRTGTNQFLVNVNIWMCHYITETLLWILSWPKVVCVCLYIHVYKYMYIRIYTYTRKTRTDIIVTTSCMCMSVHLCIYIYVYTYTYIHTQDTYGYDAFTNVCVSMCMCHFIPGTLLQILLWPQIVNVCVYMYIYIHKQVLFT